MDHFWLVRSTAWVLLLMAALLLMAPSVALGARGAGRRLRTEWAPGLIWTWLTIAVAVPMLSTIRGLNWVTALVVAMASPILLWGYRHQGRIHAAFTRLTRGAVQQAVSTDLLPTPTWTWSVTDLQRLAAVLPLSAAPLLSPVVDIRLPAPADFDTLQNATALLGHASVWDPLAALAALLVRVSSTSPFVVVSTLRLALIALVVLAVATLAMECRLRRSWAIVIALVAVACCPTLSASSWTVIFLALMAVLTCARWIRGHRSGWHASAATALLVGQLWPALGTATPMWSRRPHFAEALAAPIVALNLAREHAGTDFLVVAPPEQQLELPRDDRYTDLAAFVERYQAQAGSPAFRFNLGARRVFLFVELSHGITELPVSGSPLISSTMPVYRVPGERRKLEQRALRLADDYRRTHAGASIAYDDGALRVYEFIL